MGQIVTNFSIWKTIKLGTGLKTADDFEKAIRKSGSFLSGWARDIMSKPAFIVSSEEANIELVVASGADLEFISSATTREIFSKASSLGLCPCPPEVGPQLRLQYTNQPKSERIFIAMNEITDSDGNIGSFIVDRSDAGKYWLDCSYGHPVNYWDPSLYWVFCVKKIKI